MLALRKREWERRRKQTNSKCYEIVSSALRWQHMCLFLGKKSIHNNCRQYFPSCDKNMFCENKTCFRCESSLSLSNMTFFVFFLQIHSLFMKILFYPSRDVILFAENINLWTKKKKDVHPYSSLFRYFGDLFKFKHKIYASLCKRERILAYVKRLWFMVTKVASG
jgi:hypothetical protein